MKYLTYLILLVAFYSNAQPTTLSPNTQVSLLTISPGAELYSTFGHSAIRISDPINGIDQNYNYGDFDFNAPGFYVKFLRGYLDYKISSYNSYIEMEYWNRENRLITEQVLNLSIAQKQKLYEFLENNLLPQNRNYRYKFFTDNCSTRLRDVLQIATDDSLKFNKSLNSDSTYRQWIDKYATKNNLHWADFGMDLAIGIGADEQTGWSNAMFIPDNLMLALDEAEISTTNGIQKFVIKKYNLNQNHPITKGGSFTPSIFFMIFMLVISLFTVFQDRQKVSNIRFDKVLFSVLGIAGWLLIILWFFTDHGVTRNNLNILWASPLCFPAIFYLQEKKWAKLIFIIYALLFGIMFIYVQYFTEYRFSSAVLFLSIAIAIRLVYLFKNGYFRTQKN